MLDVLRSGRLSLGPMQERFERAFADWLGIADAVAVSSGTAALHLGVRALGWGQGDEVVTSPFSFVASANCLLYEGATPVFCDVDPITLNLDPEAAAAAVGERTAGLLPVDILGYPAAMPEFLSARRRAAASACSRTPARRSAGTTPRAGRSARVATSRPSRSTRTSSWPPGRGAWLPCPTPRPRRSCAASATRAGRPTWTGSTTTGSASTIGSRTSRPRSASRSSSASTRCWRSGRERRRCTPSAWGRSTTARRRVRATPPGSSCPAPTVATSAAAGSSTRSGCRAAPTATRCSPTSPSAASRRRPTCRAST